MTEIRKPAVRLRQGEHTLYFTALTVRDFIEREKFYRVDHLDVEGGKGMQRLLNEKRAKALARDLLAAKREASLPTSVFLATEGDIQFDETRDQIVFDPSPQGGVCPLDIVDGQHRIEGLRAAVEMEGGVTDLLDLPISAIIAPNMGEPERMLQFVVVNTKQQKVLRGVADHIIARFTTMEGITNLPHIPQWLQQEIEKGDIDRALTIVKRLNADENSPLRDLIQLADDTRPVREFVIKQATVTSAIRKYILTPSHMLNEITPDHEKRLRILKNYLCAVRDLFIGEDPRNYVVFKSNGLAFFLPIMSILLQILSRRGTSYTVDAFKQCLNDVAAHLERDEEILDLAFWRSGGIASSQNLAAIAPYVKNFNDAANSV